MNRYHEHSFSQGVGDYQPVNNPSYSHQYQMQSLRYESNYNAHYDLYKNCVNDLTKDRYFNLK